MNYAALSYRELANMATTDEGARQYVADNAVEILIDVDEAYERWHTESYDDGYATGIDEGKREERNRLRKTYLADIKETLSKLVKGNQTPLRKACRQLLKKIQGEIDE